MKRGALLVVLALATRLRAAEPFSADLLRDRLWDDGRAEYDVYAGSELREGIVRPARVVHIVVKEPFDLRSRVKSERAGASDVLKMNQVIDVPTGVYGYHQMQSTFWERTTGAVVKLSLSSNDSCGNTFKEGWIDGGSLRLVYHTYWDGEADGARREPMPAGGIFADELPMKLRCLRRFDPAEYRVRIFPSIIGSKVGAPGFADATIRVLPAEGEAVPIEVSRAGAVDRFAFDAASPHLLRSWKRADGSSLELRKSRRLDYWNHGRPGDEKLLD